MGIPHFQKHPYCVKVWWLVTNPHGPIKADWPWYTGFHAKIGAIITLPLHVHPPKYNYIMRRTFLGCVLPVFADPDLSNSIPQTKTCLKVWKPVSSLRLATSRQRMKNSRAGDCWCPVSGPRPVGWWRNALRLTVLQNQQWKIFDSQMISLYLPSKWVFIP